MSESRQGTPAKNTNNCLFYGDNAESGLHLNHFLFPDVLVAVHPLYFLN